MRYYLIAGEASGDLHGSNLMKGILYYDSQAKFRFFGGDLMASVAGELVSHYREGAFMGLDVIWHLKSIFKRLKLCKNDIIAFKPDLVILIDYPGFNMKMAKFLHQRGFRVYYYIAPKAWAWRKNRVHALRKYVDKLFVIFPFEVDFFRQYGIDVEYLGNPLVDNIFEFNKHHRVDFEMLQKKYQLKNKPIIALVPGSRNSEVKRILPLMVKAIKNFKSDYQIVVTAIHSVNKDLYEICVNEDIKIIYDNTYNIIANAKAAIVTSGTATLETALLSTPQIVVFKADWLSYVIGRPIVRIRFFSLVNIIAGFEVVKELLQFNLVEKIKNELNDILTKPTYASQIHNQYCLIFEKLGQYGVSERIAHRIVQTLK